MRQTVEIPDFIEYIMLSKKRKKIYITKENLPKNKDPETNKRYIFDDRGRLFDLETDKYVLANPRVAGKPRYYKISGQSIWSGINYNLRSKISKEMKKYFYDKIKHFVPLVNEEDYPIGIRIDLYDTTDEGDLDNFMSIYRKTITDALCGNVEFIKVKTVDGKIINIPDRAKYPYIILDDKKKYVQEINSRFYLTENERKIVIEIYKLDDI